MEEIKMTRKFKINNAIKGDIKMRCNCCKYEFEQIDRYHHLVVFDDELEVNKFLLEVVLHQRKGDSYFNYWAKREVK